MLARIAPVLSLLLLVAAVSLLAANGAFGGVDRTRTAEVPTTRPTIVISLLDIPPAPKDGAAGEEPSPTGTAGEDAQGEGPTDGVADAAGTAEGGAGTAGTTGTVDGDSADTADADSADGDAETAGTTAADGDSTDTADAAEASGDEANALSAEGQTHVVAAGETPWSIAQQYGVSVEELLSANGIEDPTTVQIGEELRVP